MTQSTSAIIDERVAAWLQRFESALLAVDLSAAVRCFTAECFWRDLVALTWNIETLEGRDAIRSMLQKQLSAIQPRGFTLAEGATEAGGLTEAWISFETAHARCCGHLRLKGDQAWTFLTAARGLKSLHERAEYRSETESLVPRSLSEAHARPDEAAELGLARQPYCLIVGGGQAGIALCAQLKVLGVPTLILDRHERPGDQWRKRQKPQLLNNPYWQEHLPYMPFPEHLWMSPAKDSIGNWMESYTDVMQLNYWSNVDLRRAQYDEAAEEWKVEVERQGAILRLNPKQLVLATGVSGVPRLPHYSGMALFEGDSSHSSRHPGGEAYRGKKAVVIGTDHSAHDICADFYESGADVTLVQRSSTHIVTSESFMEFVMGGLLHSEALIAGGVSAEKADLVFASVPFKMMQEAGFKLYFGDDEAVGLGSGSGAFELIAEGKMRLENGRVREITRSGVILENGTVLPADVIVYATGYGSMTDWVETFISPEVANKVGRCWGLGASTANDPGPWEGELRNMWKPTSQKALWFHGGNLHQSRHYALYLALQLKARMEGFPIQVHQIAKSHHQS